MEDNTQWRFVFSTQPEEASLYSLVNPRVTSASAETVDPEDNSITVTDYFHIVDPEADWPVDAPRVSVQVDQRSGQVNVRVSRALATQAHPHIARSPAQLRRAISKGHVEPAAPAAPEPARVIRPRPPPERLAGNTRAIAPSPAGIAIRTPGGLDFVPLGSIRTPTGTVWTPKGSSYSPGGTGYWPIGTKETDEGGMLTPSGTLYNPEMVGYGPSGHVYTPGGTTYSPSGVAYTSWAGQYNYQPPSPSAAPSPSPSPVSAAMSPMPPDDAPILAAQRSLGDTRIGDVPGAPHVTVQMPSPTNFNSPSPSPMAPGYFSPSQHPPTPYHSTSPMQMRSPVVYGGPLSRVLTNPVEYSVSPSPSPGYPSPGYPGFPSPSPVMRGSSPIVPAERTPSPTALGGLPPSPSQLPVYMDQPPQTFPQNHELVKPPILSPGPSPHLAELQPQEITIATTVRGPHVEHRKVERNTVQHQPSPSPLQAFEPSSPVAAPDQPLWTTSPAA